MSIPFASDSAAMPLTTIGGAGLRVVTYNIHKGVRGIGLRRRLEIHNLLLGVESLDADVVCLQEVRHYHRADAQRFGVTSKRALRPWPKQSQASYLAPAGYYTAYHTNAVTSQGEHGNAVLTRWPMETPVHRDVSDHRLEQRGFLHVPIDWRGAKVHVISVHFGLMHASRIRQAQKVIDYVDAHIAATEAVIVAGDFNDWEGKLDTTMTQLDLTRAVSHRGYLPTYPARLPVFVLDRVYARGLRCVDSFCPRGAAWTRMSDHLPLVVDMEWA